MLYGLSALGVPLVFLSTTLSLPSVTSLLQEIKLAPFVVTVICGPTFYPKVCYKV